MNVQDLQSYLDEHRVDPKAYSLAGGMPDDAFCLSREADGTWCVYYSERGCRFDLKHFPTEEEACECFFSRIRTYAERGPL